MSEPRDAFLPIFRSSNQAAIVGALFAQPDRTWTGPELAQATGASQPTVSREVQSLAVAGLVLKDSIGRTSTIRANPDSPIFDELVRIAAKTYGPIHVLGEALADLPGLVEAHIVGSWADRWHGVQGRFPNDVDVVLVGDVALIDALEVCDAAAGLLGLPVQPTVVSQDEWSQRSSAFVADARSRASVPLISPSAPA